MGVVSGCGGAMAVGPGPGRRDGGVGLHKGV